MRLRAWAAMMAVMTETYIITLAGRLDAHWSEWFAGMQLTHLEGPEAAQARATVPLPQPTSSQLPCGGMPAMARRTPGCTRARVCEKAPENVW